MQLLGGEQRKIFTQRKACLRPKNRIRARAGPVAFELTVLQYQTKEIKVLRHQSQNKMTIASLPIADCGLANSPLHNPQSAIRNPQSTVRHVPVRRYFSGRIFVKPSSRASSSRNTVILLCKLR